VVHDGPVTADDLTTGLPGAELVEAGLADLAAGRETIEALLVASARERFAELGRPVARIEPERVGIRLYALIEESVGKEHAHSRYNAVRRRLDSYLRSARPGRDASQARR
jgi:hypothetical protein